MLGCPRWVDAVEKGFLTLDRRRAFQKWAHMEKVDFKNSSFRSLLLPISGHRKLIGRLFRQHRSSKDLTRCLRLVCYTPISGHFPAPELAARDKLLACTNKTSSRNFPNATARSGGKAKN